MYKTAEVDKFAKATDSLVADLKDVRDARAYGDMTVCLSDGTKVVCHRVIMCSRCDFFRNALESGFEESNTGVINMFNDPPEAVRALIDFLYTARYEIDDGQTITDKILFHLDVLIIAQTYVVEELKKVAAQSIAESFMKFSATASLVLPDVANAFERLDISHDCGWDIVVESWCPKYDSLQSWAYDNERLFIEDNDARDAMVEKAPKLVSLIMELAWKEWKSSCADQALFWIKYFEGPESPEGIHVTVRCPEPECAGIQDRYFSTTGAARPSCEWCCGKYSLEKWMENVTDPADEADE